MALMDGVQQVFRYTDITSDSIKTLQNDITRFMLLAGVALRIGIINKHIVLTITAIPLMLLAAAVHLSFLAQYNAGGKISFPSDFFRVSALSSTALSVKFGFSNANQSTDTNDDAESKVRSSPSSSSSSQPLVIA